MEANRLVSAWWLLGAFFVGGYAGILVMALMTMARAAEPDGRRTDLRPLQPLAPGAQPQSAMDWVI
jgi:hypothetical protein